MPKKKSKIKDGGYNSKRVDGIQIIAGIVAAIGLVIAYFAFKRNRESIETNLTENIFRDLRALEKEKYGLTEDIEKKKDWASLFFNTLEWFAFLVNEKKIKDEKIKNFFKEAIVDWYEIIFLDNDYIEDKQVTNAKEFPEFKKLYKKLKKCKDD
jgi:hypothetical protein